MTFKIALRKYSQNFDLPCEQKIGLEELFGSKHLKMRRNADYFGCEVGLEFLGGLKPWSNKADKFAGNFAEEFAEKFADNFPKIRQLGSRDLS